MSGQMVPMQSVLRIKTTINEEGKIEISHPSLLRGLAVDVIIFLPTSTATTKRSAVDILAEAPGHRLLNAGEEVDNYLAKESAS